MSPGQKKGAAGETGAPLEKTSHVPKHNNTIAQAQDGDAIDEIIAGQAAGDAFLLAVRNSYCATDELYIKFSGIAADRDRLKGFCRSLQKFIERATS